MNTEDETEEGKEPAEGVLVLSVESEADGKAMAAFRERARRHLAAGARALILDLSSVHYLSEEGAAALLGLRKDAHKQGTPLLLANLSPFTKSKLTRTGLIKLFSVHSSVEVARATL